MFKEWWKYIWKWQADSHNSDKESLGYTNESPSQRNSLPSVSSLMRMSFTLHWSFSFPAFDTFHLFSKIPPISLGTPLSHACRLRCYIPWNFSDNSRSLVISFKIPATQILIHLFGFIFKIRPSMLVVDTKIRIFWRLIFRVSSSQRSLLPSPNILPPTI